MDNSLAMIATVVFVSLLLSYLIIKAAVKDGTKEQVKQLTIQNRLLSEQLAQSGVPIERIEELFES